MGAVLIIVATRKEPTISATLAEAQPTPELENYSGSSSCRECHAEQFSQWEKSHHGQAERTLSAEIDGPAFNPAREIFHGKQRSLAREREKIFELVTQTRVSQTNAVTLARVIGVEPLRQYLVPAPGGRWQAAELAYDPRQNDWFNIFGDEDRQPGEWGHWTGRGMTWNSMCASCHNTAVQKNYDPVTDSYQTRMAEMSVSCEACHGPMKTHVVWQQSNRGSTRTDPTLRPQTRDQMLDTCGSCHARRGELTGKFLPGEPFSDHYSLTIPDETDTYYPDGQVRDEDFEFTAFLGSKMHAAGVRCVDCHNPHTGKTKLPGNNLCMQCHSNDIGNAPRIDPITHTFHAPNTSGSFCVDCHMPQTTYMQRHPRRDHGFTIPDPLLTKQHGIPNACNRCHQEQSPDWALEQVNRWYGEKMNRSTRQRADLLARARSGETNVVGPLLETLRGETIPLWRASILTLLRDSMGDQRVMQEMLGRTSDPDPVVRSAAARAIAPLAEQKFAPAITALQALLQDESRLVRIDAAWALRQRLDTNSPAGRDLLQQLTQNSDQPAGALQLGHFHLARHDLSNALAWLQRSVAWEPGSPHFRHDFAIALNLAGQNRKSITQLEEACRISPGDAEYHYKLALAWHEAGNLQKAIQILEKAVEIEPRHSRAWYNLGLGYASDERLDDAIKALERAEMIDTRTPEIPYARATVLARMGLRNEAKAAASIALERDPGFTAAAQFMSRP